MKWRIQLKKYISNYLLVLFDLIFVFVKNSKVFDVPKKKIFFKSKTLAYFNKQQNLHFIKEYANRLLNCFVLKKIIIKVLVFIYNVALNVRELFLKV